MHAGMYMRKPDAYAYIHTSSMYGVYVCIYIYIYVCVCTSIHTGLHEGLAECTGSAQSYVS